MTAPVDYGAVLADLEARRAEAKAKLGQVEAAIAVFRAMYGLAPDEPSTEDAAESSTATPTVVAPARPSTTIQSDTFFGLSTSDAVRKYLAMMKRPQTPQAIAIAIREGGQIHATDEKIAYRNVYTALTRSKDFVKTRNKEWGLSEWYGAKAKTDSE